MQLIRLDNSFFHRDCLDVAPDLVGKLICRRLADGSVLQERIAETEAYRGEEDLACHAIRISIDGTALSRKRRDLCLSLLWHSLANDVITGEVEQPQGVLIRAGEVHYGPAKLTKYLQVDKRFNGDSFVTCPDLWIADDGFRPVLHTDARVGIDYAGEYWKNMPWRWVMGERVLTGIIWVFIVGGIRDETNM